MYAEIVKKYKVIERTSASFLKEEWFVGSALMGQDFKQFKEGIYTYRQETIWTKVLELERINPYWEIYNRTSNFLLVDQPDTLALSFLLDLLKEMKAYFSKEFSFVFLASDPSLSELLLAHNCELIFGKIPFFIDKSLVGSYLKIFVKQKGHYIPLLDCTIFDIEKKHYFEINCNQLYVEFLDYFLHRRIPPKFKRFEQIFSINLSDSFLNFIAIQEQIRLVSLFDCLTQLSKHSVKIGGNYRGHTTKKLLKRLALSATMLDVDLKKGYFLLDPDYGAFLEKEREKIQNRYPKLMKTYSKEILKERYGLTDVLYRYLSGHLLVSKIGHELQGLTYFTDLPFLSKPLLESDFKRVVKNIIAGKKGGENDSASK